MTITCPHCKAEHPDEATVCPTTQKELSQALRLVGKSIGKYQILHLIGEGGMGSVYEARHMESGTNVALKLLHPKYAQDHEALSRFSREAEVTRKIGHENIREIYSVDKDEITGATYLVMAFLEGKSLKIVVDEKAMMSIPEAVDIIIQVLSALNASHDLGIIHRDLKPENIFTVTTDGEKNRVKLLDFGIAKMRQSGEISTLTQSGQIIGTPYYMTPEQLHAEKDIDHRIDLYACGVILYQCITGRVPYDGPTMPALVFLILNGDPIPPRSIRKDVPEELSQIILKAFSRDRGARFQSASEMASALEKFSSGKISIEKEMERGLELVSTLRATAGELVADISAGGATDMKWKQTEGKIEKHRRKRKRVTTIIIAATGISLLAVALAFLSIQGFPGSGEKKEEVAATGAGNNANAGKHIPDGGSNSDEPYGIAQPPEKVTFAIEAGPPGAAIYLDGTPLGRNPYSGEFSRSDTARLIEVKLDGYNSYMEWIKFSEPVQRAIKLTAPDMEEPKKIIGKGAKAAPHSLSGSSENVPKLKMGKGGIKEIYDVSPYK